MEKELQHYNCSCLSNYTGDKSHPCMIGIRTLQSHFEYVVHTQYPACSPTDSDSVLHGCLSLPCTGQKRLPEHSVVYLITLLALHSSIKLCLHNRSACLGGFIASTEYLGEG